MKVIIKLGAFVFLFALFVSGCVTMESRWEETKSVNTIQAYRKFLNHYPRNTHAREAWDRISELHWQEAIQTNTISAYREFLRDPETNLYLYADEAKKQIARIEEQAAYKKAIRSDSIKALKKFLTDYPDSSKSIEITSRISDLETQAEEELHQLAVNSGSYQILQRYLQQFPNGRYYNQIKQKLDSFSWTVLSSAQVLQWKQIGKQKPLSTTQISNHIRNSSTFFTLKGCLQAGGAGGLPWSYWIRSYFLRKEQKLRVGERFHLHMFLFREQQGKWFDFKLKKDSAFHRLTLTRFSR